MGKITLTEAEWKIVTAAMSQGGDWVFSLYHAWGDDESKEGRAYLRDYNRIHKVRRKLIALLAKVEG